MTHLKTVVVVYLCKSQLTKRPYERYKPKRRLKGIY